MADREQDENAVEYSSGNVFSDLGLPDSEELMVKAKLLARISQVISQRKLTQVAAGKLLGMDQPKVSDLVRGKTTKFSTERLIKACLLYTSPSPRD